MRLGWTAALLALLAGCITASRVVRLDTGQADTLVFTPRSSAEPVNLNGDEFKETVAKRAWEVRPSTRPQDAARKLFEVEARSGSYTYETRSRRVTPLRPDEHPEGAPPAAEVELTRAYLRWCERTGRPGDCLRLLTESPIVNGDGRFALALALAKGSVLDEMLEAFKGSGATSAPLSASGDDISVKDAHVDVPKHNIDRLAPTWPEQRQFLIDAVRQLDGKVSALATTPQGSIFESTLKINDRFGGIANLTIRWFKYTDGRITINTAFIPP